MTNNIRILPYYSYEDWLAWEGRWELIDGIPFAMMPSPSPRHQLIAANICAAFVMALRSHTNRRYRVYNPIDYKISDHTILEPDILLVCDDIEKDYLDFAPALLVEILSTSTLLKDRYAKFNIYQQQGVKYYLIADPEKDKLEIYELVDKVYRPATIIDENRPEFLLEEGCSIQPDFSQIWQ